MTTSLNFISCTWSNSVIPRYFFIYSASSVIQAYRCPILHLGLFISPQNSYQLPDYAKAAAQAYAHSLSPSYDSDRFSRDRRILEYLDISAEENNNELEEYFLDVNDDASSSMSCLVSATSCSSSPSSTSNIVSHS